MSWLSPDRSTAKDYNQVVTFSQTESLTAFARPTVRSARSRSGTRPTNSRNDTRMRRADHGSRPEDNDPRQQFACSVARALGLTFTSTWLSTLFIIGCTALGGLLITGASPGPARQCGRWGPGTGRRPPTDARQQQQQPQPIPSLDTGARPNLTRRQKRELLKANFEKMKKDTDVLLDVAKSLQEDLDGDRK